MAPVDGSTNEQTVVELQWNTSESSVTFHLQVADTPDLSRRMVDEKGIAGNAYPLFDLNREKFYYWRVRAENETGLSDWTPVWRFEPTQDPVVPAVPSLVAPADHSLDMPTEVIFTWQPVPGAATYHLQVSLEENFIRRSADMEGIRGTSQLIKELVPTYIYYWRVRAINPLGKSSWSPTWELVIEDDL